MNAPQRCSNKLTAREEAHMMAKHNTFQRLMATRHLIQNSEQYSIEMQEFRQMWQIHKDNMEETIRLGFQFLLRVYRYLKNGQKQKQGTMSCLQAENARYHILNKRSIHRIIIFRRPSCTACASHAFIHRKGPSACSPRPSLRTLQCASYSTTA